MSFQRTMVHVYIFNTLCSPQCLATHSSDWFVNKSEQKANFECKFMPTSQDLFVSTWQRGFFFKKNMKYFNPVCLDNIYMDWIGIKFPHFNKKNSLFW